MDAADLVIADGERAIALAGIMGGEETEIGDGTTEVLLEAANFEPVGIFRTSERLRLRTEGSNRWEKGVDPHLAPHAADLATELILELTGARWTGDADVHDRLPERPVVRFRPQRADEVIGIETPPDERAALLKRLGFELERRRVAVPTWRARDVTREIDVVEEIARFRLDDVPFTLPPRRAMFGTLTREQRLRRRVEDDARRARTSPRRIRRACGRTTTTRGTLLGADQGRADRTAHPSAPEPRGGGAPQRGGRREGRRDLRDRPRLPPERRPTATSAARRPRSPRAPSCTRRASSRRSTPR